MAVINNTVQTYDRVGIREDLSDMIYDISPEETPMLSAIGRGKVSNTLSEWQQDALLPPDTDNAHIQGDDAAFEEAPPTTRLGNYTQISRKTVIVAGTTEAVNKAGRKSELAYQTAKRAKELKIDMESIILSNQAASAGAAGTAPRTGSMLAFIKSNVNMAADGANPVYTTVPSDTRTDGTQRALTEEIFKDVIQRCWTSGNVPKVVQVGAHNKTVISGFKGIADKVFNLNSAEKAATVAAADVYVSDFGTIKVIPNRWMRARDAIFLDPEYVEVAYLRPFQRVPLAKTGDADKRMLIVEWMLKVKAEAALGLAADLTTSA